MKVHRRLSPGECMVLTLLATDASYKEIASDIARETGTVSAWATRAYRKLGADGRDDAIAKHRRLRDHTCHHLRLAFSS